LPALFERLRHEVREARVAAIIDEARAWAARQPLPEFRPDAGPPPGYPASWPSAIALADVVRWRDADFVRACYEAILRRAPDPAGFALYLNEVRSGRSRVEIAVGFARSDEGRKAGVAIAGLEAAAWSLRFARIPVLGYLLRLAKSLLLLPRALREREATEAYLAAQVAIAEARMAEVAARAAAEAHRVRLETAFVHERQARNLGARLARLADQSQAVLDRLPAVEGALQQVRAAGVAELGHAVATLRAEIDATATSASAAAQGVQDTAREAAHTARQALGVAREASGDRDTREARFAAIDAQLSASRQSAAAIEARATATSLQAVAALRAELAAAPEAIARLEASQQQLAARFDAALTRASTRLDREIEHGAAQDAQMKAVREAGMAELAQATAALEAKLLELVTRENELLERRLAGRVEAAATIAQEVEALRAALATFRKDGSA
jgi:hypothetical protein